MTSHSNHRQLVCRHGDVYVQCRCAGPKVDKLVDCEERCWDRYGERLLAAVEPYVGRHRAEVTS